MDSPEIQIATEKAKTMDCAFIDKKCAADECMAWIPNVVPRTTFQDGSVEPEHATDFGRCGRVK